MDDGEQGFWLPDAHRIYGLWLAVAVVVAAQGVWFVADALSDPTLGTGGRVLTLLLGVLWRLVPGLCGIRYGWRGLRSRVTIDSERITIYNCWRTYEVEPAKALRFEPVGGSSVKLRLKTYRSIALSAGRNEGFRAKRSEARRTATIAAWTARLNDALARARPSG